MSTLVAALLADAVDSYEDGAFLTKNFGQANKSSALALKSPSLSLSLSLSLSFFSLSLKGFNFCLSDSFFLLPL